MGLLIKKTVYAVDYYTFINHNVFLSYFMTKNFYFHNVKKKIFLEGICFHNVFPPRYNILFGKVFIIIEIVITCVSDLRMI